MSFFFEGFALLKQYKYREAIGIFSRAVELNSESEEAFINRGIAFNALGLYEKALDDFNSALILNSNNVKTLMWLGAEKENLGKYPLDDYNRAIQIDPMCDQAYYLRGRYFYDINGKKCDLKILYRIVAKMDKEGTRLSSDFTYDDCRVPYASLARAISDYTVAAKLGNEKARVALKAAGLSW